MDKAAVPFWPEIAVGDPWHARDIGGDIEHAFFPVA